ncbi:MAG TPA: pyridoxal-phosphate dependent enzyme, partial [Candidatus Binataceae bacterium]|nr:pyridoxal-phosphate dependent enzyme [Candidatus Binataceae bacterium]
MPAARAHSVLELIGNTPLLEITRVTEGLLRPGVRIFAKLEGFNPGGSVKDRAARHMIEFGLKRGELRPGKVIIDSTSGNTGIALAMVGAALGYPVEIVMASNVSRERKKIIEAFGAKPIYSDPLEGSDGAMLMARQI